MLVKHSKNWVSVMFKDKELREELSRYPRPKGTGSTCNQKIIKTSGHCYDGCGWANCSFWSTGKELVFNEAKAKAEEVPFSRCMLFGGKNGVEKYTSESLQCCNAIYGYHFEGRP